MPLVLIGHRVCPRYKGLIAAWGRGEIGWELFHCILVQCCIVGGGGMQGPDRGCGDGYSFKSM